MEVEAPPNIRNANGASGGSSTLSGNGNGSTSSQMETTNGVPNNFDDFLNTGRTGRRNAVPDLNEDGSARVSTADLPLELEKLSCSDSIQGNGASTSQSRKGAVGGNGISNQAQ